MANPLDTLSFQSDVGKSIGSLASSGLGKSVSGLSSSLSNAGLSLPGLKNFISSKADSLSNALGQNVSRFSGNLFTERSQLFKGAADPSQVFADKDSDSTLAYPTDNLRNEFFTLRFYKYVRPTTFEKSKARGVLTVHLPIPRNLSEQFTIDVAPTALKTIGAAIPIGVNAYNEVTGEGSTSRDQYAKDAIGLLGSAVKEKISQSATGEAIGNLAGQYLGTIPNPHISVFFNGVDLRPAIEFSWLFTPKSEQDSIRLKEVLTSMKKLILPAISAGAGNVMDYPHMAQAEIHGLAEDTTPIYKLGLITALNINYTPNGPSFFKRTNAPTFIAFSFLYQEIEIITSNDFKGDASTQEGQALDILKNIANFEKADSKE